jgi:UDP:flavonoid glycosyltransferase YjiC (YdhE family)
MPQKKRILICPLDWGLGHATRCIPVIQLLLQKDAEVLIAGSGRSLALLKKEFPALTTIDLPGYDIQYSNGSLALKIFLSTPKVFKAISREHEELEKIIREKKIDLVISDNRFGLWNKQVKTIFITHQLYIKAPIGERLLYRINRYYINKFTECWIPDVAGSANLSGDLSHPYPMPVNAFFIGTLSRFRSMPVSIVKPAFPLKKEYDVLVILSGPEPQRSIFEQIIIDQAARIPLNFLIARGVTELAQTMETKNNLDIVSHLTAAELKEVLLISSVIVSRSGYSTIMDLAALKKKAIFVPTPGQTEQEYLAQRCMKMGFAYTETQGAFDLKRALTEVETYNGFEGFKEPEEKALEKRMNLLLTPGKQLKDLTEI